MTTNQIVSGMLRGGVAAKTVIVKNGVPSAIVMKDGEDANSGAIDVHDIPPNVQGKGLAGSGRSPL